MDFKQHLQKAEIFQRDAWTCCVCGRPIRIGQPQLAHVIPQSKMYLKKYGDEIIHHSLNMKSTCGLECNGKVSINGKHKLIEELVKKIRKEING